MSFLSQNDRLKKICSELLESGSVKVVIGFTAGMEGMNAAPYFMRAPGEVKESVWDETCTPNLAKYLPEMREKAAIVAKPCDARAIVMYLAEKQVGRDNLYIIGMECAGMKGKNAKPSPGCESCGVRIPPVCDVLVGFGENGNDGGDLSAQNREGRKNAVMDERLSGLSPEEKLGRFERELQKCILCYSCRQACYGCYCKTCFAERNIPNWLPAEIDTGTKMVFHLGRAMHLAGRCVECGACERVCPSGVKIRYLINEINDFVEEQYGYRAGMDPAEAPAMSAYCQDDREIGFLGGEGDRNCCDTQK